MKQRKCIWVVSDGRPGHFNQSKGVVALLTKQFDCDVYWLEMTLRMGVFRRLLRLLINTTCRVLPVSLLRIFYRFDDLPRQEPDLLVGAGGKISFALAWLSRAIDAPAVFSGSLRGLAPRHFSLVLTIDPRHAGPKTLVLDVAPMFIDIAVQEQSAKSLRQKLCMDKQPLWLLLIGGDGAGYEYSAADWRRLAAEANDLARDYGARWLVSTSRRTGAEAEGLLRESLSNDLVVDAVWWNSSPRKIMQAYVGAAETVFCTVDSLSMMTEVILSGHVAIAWSPRISQPSADYLAALWRLKNKSLLVCENNLRQGYLKLMKQPPNAIDFCLLEQRLTSIIDAKLLQ